jgi:hypothetical protein
LLGKHIFYSTAVLSLRLRARKTEKITIGSSDTIMKLHYDASHPENELFFSSASYIKPIALRNCVYLMRHFTSCMSSTVSQRRRDADHSQLSFTVSVYSSARFRNQMLGIRMIGLEKKIFLSYSLIFFWNSGCCQACCLMHHQKFITYLPARDPESGKVSPRLTLLLTANYLGLVIMYGM